LRLPPRKLLQGLPPGKRPHVRLRNRLRRPKNRSPPSRSKPQAGPLEVRETVITRRALLASVAIPALKAQPAADYKLVIDHSSLEIAPKTIIKTLAYNGSAPGPLLRMKEGRRVTIDVTNNTSDPEIVHW